MSDIIPANQAELIVDNQRPFDQDPAAVYLARLRPSGRRTQAQALSVIAGILTGNPDIFSLNWAALRYQHTAAIRAQLEENYSAASTNKFLCALRGVLKQAWKLGQMSGDDYHLAASVESVTGETLPAGRGLQPGEIKALMEACENDPSPAGARDAAIIGVMYGAGLRREEVTALSLASWDPAEGKLTVKGKRNKERAAWLKNGAGRALNDWLAIRGKEGEPLFCAINKSGRLDIAKPMTPQAIYNVLCKRAEEAGVSHFSPHDLRRSFISDLLEAGADIAVVSKMAGHANVQTTIRYDRRPEEAKQKAAGLIHVPYRGRLA